jgi:hypothetical protein
MCSFGNDRNASLEVTEPVQVTHIHGIFDAAPQVRLRTRYHQFIILATIT